MTGSIPRILSISMMLLACVSSSLIADDGQSNEQRLADAFLEVSNATYQLNTQYERMNRTYPGWRTSYKYAVDELKEKIQEGENKIIPVARGELGEASAWVLQRNYELKKKIDKLKKELARQQALLSKQRQMYESTGFKEDEVKLDQARKDLRDALEKQGKLKEELKEQAIEDKRAARVKKGLQALLVFGLDKAPFDLLYGLAKELEYGNIDKVISAESDQILFDLISKELERRNPEKLMALALIDYYNETYGRDEAGGDPPRPGSNSNPPRPSSTYQQLVTEIAQTSEIVDGAGSQGEQEYLENWQESGGRQLTPAEIAEMDAEFAADDQGAPINPEFQPGALAVERVDPQELQDITDGMDQAFGDLYNQMHGNNHQGAPVDGEFQPGAFRAEQVGPGALQDIVDRMNEAMEEFNEPFGIDPPGDVLVDNPEDNVADNNNNVGGLDNPFGFGIQEGDGDIQPDNVGSPIGGDEQDGSGGVRLTDEVLANILGGGVGPGSDGDAPPFDDTGNDQGQSVVPGDIYDGDFSNPFSDELNNSMNVSMMMSGYPPPPSMGGNITVMNVGVTQNQVNPAVFNLDGSDPFSVPGFNVTDISGFVTCPSFNDLAGMDFLTLIGDFDPSGTFMNNGHVQVGGTLNNVTITDGAQTFCTGGTGGANATVIGTP